MYLDINVLGFHVTKGNSVCGVCIELALAVFFDLIQITPVIARIMCRGSWAVKLEMGEGESLREKGIAMVVKLFHLFAASTSLNPPPPISMTQSRLLTKSCSC